MVIYLVFLFFCITFILHSNKNTDQKFVLLFLLLFVIMGFRDYSVGTDTQSYIDEYEEGISFLRGTDFGFAILLGGLQFLGIKSRGFLLVATALTLYPIYIFLKQNNNSKLLSVFLYFTIGCFSFNMTGVRQSIAIGFFLLGIILWNKMNTKKFKYLLLCIMIFLAYTVHGSAYICFLIIPFVLMSKHDIFRIRSAELILISLPIICLLFIGIFEGIVNHFMTAKYEQYEADASDVNIIAYFIIPYLLFIYSSLLFFKYKPVDRCTRILYFCSFLYALSASASLYMPILARSGYYFSLPMFAFISDYTYRLPIKMRRLIIPAIMILSSIYFLMSTNGGILHLDDYRFAF